MTSGVCLGGQEEAPRGTAFRGRHLEETETEPEPEREAGGTPLPRASWVESATPALGQPGPGGARGRPAPGADCCQGAERHSDTQAGQPYPSPGIPPTGAGSWAEGREGVQEEPQPCRSQPKPSHHSIPPASRPHSDCSLRGKQGRGMAPLIQASVGGKSTPESHKRGFCFRRRSRF